MTLRQCLRRTARGCLVLWLTGTAGLATAQAATPAQAACPPTPAMPSAAQMQAAQRAAADHGFLWRLSKDGRSSYLYGTLHIGKLDWAFPGPRLRDALAQVDTLAVEVDLPDPSVAQAMGEATRAPGAAVLAEPLRERLRRQIAAACVPEGLMAPMHPMMQAITLTVLAGRWEGLDAGYAQEIVLGAQARASRLPIVSLETAQSQLELLMPKDDAQLQRLLTQTLEQLERGRVRPVLRRLAQVWEKSELDALEQYERWCECADSAEDRAFLAQLNDARNAPMAERIDRLHGEGKRLLVAVGALHMTGPQGLPRLLAGRGFQVERLTPATR
jgi:uncharacterized protein YbaP (TraB family)